MTSEQERKLKLYVKKALTSSELRMDYNLLVRLFEIPERFQKDHDSRCRYLILRAAQDILGGRCHKCGFDDWRVLEFDHINGDGRDDREQRGQSLARLLLKNHVSFDRIQLLCANCHRIKTYENKEGWDPKYR